MNELVERLQEANRLLARVTLTCSKPSIYEKLYPAELSDVIREIDLYFAETTTPPDIEENLVRR